MVILKVTLCKAMSKNKKVDRCGKRRFLGQKETSFLAPYPSTFGQFQLHGCM
jgi:hypothetical protein